MTRFLPFALVLLTAITAQAFGAAHGLRWTGETMEICRGGGVAVVPIPGGDEGQVHLCPDAAVAQFTDTASAATPSRQGAAVSADVLARAPHFAAPSVSVGFRARDPPTVGMLSALTSRI